MVTSQEESLKMVMLQDRTLASVPQMTPELLGDDSFKKDYHLKYALYAGAMASGIASVRMVCEMGKAGFLGSFGAGGLSIEEVESAIDKIKKELVGKSFMVNILSQRNEQKEMEFVEMLLRKEVSIVEASAYVRLSEALVFYRVKGIKQLESGRIEIPHRIIAKVSREEVFRIFMAPPAQKLVEKLFEAGKITKQEKELAQEIPMADDITVEGDSGGHTDQRPLIVMFPSILALRDRMQVQYQYQRKVRVGAGGGIGTGRAALAAFMMGAAYVVTGSVNQSCVEAGTSDYVKNILKNVTTADVTMAPCSDMFELGGKVQVTKKGSMYAQNAAKLYDYYIKYNSFYEISEKDRMKIEDKILKEKYEVIWEDTRKYFISIHDEEKVKKAETDLKKQMALVFRWYLGKSSKWAILGQEDRKMDMQIWCGAALGAFNSWVKGTYLEELENRKVADVSYKILDSAAEYYMAQLELLYRSAFKNDNLVKEN